MKPAEKLVVVLSRKKKEKSSKVKVVVLDDLDQSPVREQKRLEDFLEEQRMKRA